MWLEIPANCLEAVAAERVTDSSQTPCEQKFHSKLHLVNLFKT